MGVNPWHYHHRIMRAAALLHGGAVVAYPTEAVWGLGCDPHNEMAANHILAIKRRKRDMGLILVASSITQLTPYLRGLNQKQQSTLADSWPGPSTWLVPDNGVAPNWVTGGRTTLALRVSAHPLVAALCEAFGGPIVSTSANPHGLPPARTAIKTRCYFEGLLDDILPGRVGSDPQPTSIRDLLSGALIRA